MVVENRVVVSPMDQYSRGRRRARRLALRAPRHPRGRRRGPGLRRDDLPVARSAHLAGLHRPVERGAARRLQAHRRFLPRQLEGEDVHAARPFGAQGLDPARLGAHGLSARERQLAGGLRFADPVLRGGFAGPAGADARRDGRRSSAISKNPPATPTRPASTCSSCTWRTATCSRASSRRSPTSASDEYGGAIENRMRFPLEVFAACRKVWPEAKPMSVRISATDWAPGGLSGEDLMALTRMLKEAGCDMIDCSTGQTVPHQRPVYGRMYQAPYLRLGAQRGRHRHHDGRRGHQRPTRSTRCSPRARRTWSRSARPHLANPYFTLQASAWYQHMRPVLAAAVPLRPRPGVPQRAARARRADGPARHARGRRATR